MVQLSMGDGMAKMIEEGKQNEYYEIVFGKNFPKSDEVLSEKEEKMIQAALDRAHEIRKFEIELYWKRSLFFWGFMTTFLAIFALFFNSHNENSANTIAMFFKSKNDNFASAIAMILSSCMGLFTSFAWRYIEIGSKTWQANWEKHIDFLENPITGKLHKVNIGKPLEFFSVSGIHSTFICSMIWFWFGLFLLSICPIVISLVKYMGVYNSIEECLMMLQMHSDVHKLFYFLASIAVILLIMLPFLILIMLPFLIFRCFLRRWIGPMGTWHEGTWRTNFGTEPPAEPIKGDELTLRNRGSPNVTFVHEPYKQDK